MTTEKSDSLPEYGWIVETFEPHDSAELGPSNESLMHALAARIIADQKNGTGKFRRIETFRCTKCSNRKGREPEALSTTYVDSSGQQYILLPRRSSSSGEEARTRTVHPKARLAQDLLTGVEFSQCGACLTFFVLAGIRTEDGKINIWVTNILESTFGAVEDDGRPSVVHKVKMDKFMSAYIRARQEAEQL